MARLDAASQAETGHDFELSLDTTALKLFDPASGKALR